MKIRALVLILLNAVALTSTAMDRDVSDDIARLPQLKATGEINGFSCLKINVQHMDQLMSVELLLKKLL